MARGTCRGPGRQSAAGSSSSSKQQQQHSPPWQAAPTRARGTVLLRLGLLLSLQVQWAAAKSPTELQVEALGSLRLNPTPQQFSSFACSGLPHHDMGQDNTQSCRFHNICLDHQTYEFLYFLDPALRSAYVNQSGEGMEQFPPDFVHADAAASWYIPVYGDLATKHWRPTVVREAIPPAPDAVYASAPVHVLFAPRGPLYNFGHAMYDFLQPVFNLLVNFKMYTPDFQLMWYVGKGDYFDMSDSKSKLLSGSKDHSLIRLISKNDALVYGDYVPLNPEAKFTCFHTLLVGGRIHNPYYTVQGFSAGDMRAAAVQLLGLDGVERQTDRPRILIFNKKGRRHISNIDEILDALRTAHPHAELQVVTSEELESMTIPQQVELMSRTAVYVSPPGGALAIALFMPPGGAVITLNGRYASHPHINTAMDSAPMSKWTHLMVESLPIMVEDLQTPPHFECMGVEKEGFKNCNYWLRPQTVKHLVETVGRGLALWQMQHGHALNA